MSADNSIPDSFPPLYSDLNEEDIPAAFGLGGDLRTLCGGQWLFSKNRGICKAFISDQASFFSSGGTFNWVASEPFQCGTQSFPSIPAEIRGGECSHELYLLAAITPRVFRFLGRIAPSYVYGADNRSPNGGSHHDLVPTLPSHLWKKFGGYPCANGVGNAVENLAELYGRASNTGARIDLLRQLAEGWSGPISPEEGVRLEETQALHLPAALREWYAAAGKRDGVVGCKCCDHLCEPQNIAIHDDGYHVFYVEAQGVCLWAWRENGDDPRVWSNTDGAGWCEEECTVSQFLIQAFVANACRHGPYGASAACLPADAVKHVTEPLVKLGAWLWPPEGSALYAGKGVVAWVAGNGSGYCSVWVGARTEKPLAYLKPLLSEAWEYVSM